MVKLLNYCNIYLWQGIMWSSISTPQTPCTFNLGIVCIWLGTKCDEWGCEWLDEWMNALNELSTVLYVINGCVTEIYFRRFQLFGKNVMNDWCEWVNGIYFSVSTDWLINQINCLIVLFFSLIYCSFLLDYGFGLN